MADIHQEIEPASCVKFTADTVQGHAWMSQNCHETTVTFSLLNSSERAEAERFVKRATDAGLTVSEL